VHRHYRFGSRHIVPLFRGHTARRRTTSFSGCARSSRVSAMCGQDRISIGFSGRALWHHDMARGVPRARS
jgi:hypothetical protein